MPKIEEPRIKKPNRGGEAEHGERKYEKRMTMLDLNRGRFLQSTGGRLALLFVCSVMWMSAFAPAWAAEPSAGESFKGSRFHLAGLWLKAGVPQQIDVLQLLSELNRRTQVDPENDAWQWIKPDEVLKAPPFLWLFVDANTTVDPVVSRDLQRYIANGGTVMVEGVGGISRGAIVAWREAVFPERKIEVLKKDALLTRTFYILEPSFSSSLKTMHQSGRVVWVESSLPLLSGLKRPSSDREMKVRACINIVLYTLTGDYKDDLTHLKYLMRRRKS